jgi:hypothetical protein
MDYILYRHAAYQRRLDRKREEFKEEDAHDLLFGKDDNVLIVSLLAYYHYH